MSTNIPEHLVTPRDWQAEALAFAARELGTPEGRRALIEARRYGALADQIDAMRRGLTAAHDALLSQRAEVEVLRRERDELRARLAEIERQEPAAWIEHEFQGTGQRHLHFERRPRTVRDEVVAPIWTALIARPELAQAAAQSQAEPADGCGACGDACKSRGPCRLAEESPAPPGWKAAPEPTACRCGPDGCSDSTSCPRGAR